MLNHDTQPAWAFHNATKYFARVNDAGVEQLMMGTPPDVQESIWQEDWTIEPLGFKIFEDLEPRPLPTDFVATSMPGIEAIARTGAEPGGEVALDRAALARIAQLSNGLLHRQTTSRGGMTIEYRTSGCTGGRYHLELFFVCGELVDLPAGVYHYAAHDHSFRQVRAGDYRGVLVDASGAEPAIADAPAVLVMTSHFWRNAWRYKGRAYRHAFWDAGTMFANALAAAASVELATELVFGFADAEVNRLVGVDGEREAALALCALGRMSAPPPPSVDVAPVHHAVRPVSPREMEFPVIPMTHEAAKLTSGQDAARWRSDPLLRPEPVITGELVELRPLPTEQWPATPVEELIFERRSTRHFDLERPLTFEVFSTLLASSSRGFAADALSLDTRPLHDAYLIVNRVEGLQPGVYVHHPQLGAIELLREGDFRANAARLAADQQYAADAHVNIYYLTDLTTVLARYGNRGYRLAQLEASLYAGKLHLAAHALGHGAVGSTSYDDEVIEFFSPHAAGKSYMFVLTFGRRRRRTAR